MVGNTISATPPQRFSFVFDPSVTPTITVRVVRRNHRVFQKTVGRTITVAAPPPRYSIFIFDPDRSLQDDYHSVVCCLLHNLKFQQFHSVKFYSMPVPSSSVKYMSRSFDSVLFGFAFFCSIFINTLGSIAASLGFEWAGLATSLIGSPFLIGPNPFQLWRCIHSGPTHFFNSFYFAHYVATFPFWIWATTLLEWKGLTPENTSWENWDALCFLYHLKDKVVFPTVGNDSNKAPGPEKDPRPKRELKRPEYLKDYG